MKRSNKGDMIYRVHKPHNPDGTYGPFMGYITLCVNQAATVANIYTNLLSHKLISNDWLKQEELSIANVPSGIYGMNALSLSRKSTRIIIMYMHPVESIDEQLKPKVIDGYGSKGYVSYGGMTGTAVSTFNLTTPAFRTSVNVAAPGRISFGEIRQQLHPPGIVQNFRGQPLRGVNLHDVAAIPAQGPEGPQNALPDNNIFEPDNEFAGAQQAEAAVAHRDRAPLFELLNQPFYLPNLQYPPPPPVPVNQPAAEPENNNDVLQPIELPGNGNE